MYTGNKTQKASLKRFIEYLRKIPTKGFDMTAVCAVNVKNKGADFSCGTAACAIGNLPKFNPKRFEYAIEDSEIVDGVLYYTVIDKETGLDEYLGIAVEYFGLTREQSMVTFNGGHYNCIPFNVTPKMVAKRLENIMNGKE